MTQWDRATALSSADDEDFQVLRAWGLATAGMIDDAVAEIDRLSHGGQKTDFNYACVVALASAACKSDPDRREALALRAVEELRRFASRWPHADDNKSSLSTWMRQDPDLASVRGRSDFRALVAEVEEEYRRAHNLPAVAPPPREVGR